MKTPSRSHHDCHPEPRHFIVFENTEGSVPTAYPHGPDAFGCIDALKVEGRMKRILLPHAVRFARTFFDGLGERFICGPEGRNRSGLHRSLLFKGFALPSAISFLARRAAATSCRWVFLNALSQLRSSFISSRYPPDALRPGLSIFRQRLNHFYHCGNCGRRHFSILP